MFQKHRMSRVWRILSLEALEDRTVLSGFVTAIQDANTGAVFISGDDLDNAFQINQGGTGASAALQVSAIPGSNTAVNGVTSGVGASFPLSSVNGLFIADGNGNNTILLGNIQGFNLAGNIQFDTGSGTDKVQVTNITVPAGGIGFSGWHGTGTGTDTIDYTNVRAGSSLVTPGLGKLTLTQTNVVLDFDGIFGSRAQTANDSIRITDSMFHPPPRLYAIGQLTITEGNADNSFFINSIDVGPTVIVSGTGNNSLTFSTSLILTDATTLGTEAAGAQGNNTVVMDHDTITGQFVTLSVLNQSGISGVLANGAAGVPQTVDNVAVNPDDNHRNQVQVNHVTLTNTTFTTAFPVTTPQLFVQIDDGDYYYDTQHGNAISGTTFVATNSRLPGLASITLGDHCQLVELGQLGTVTNGIPAGTNTNIFTAGQLSLNAGNDLDTVILSANVTGESIPTPPSPDPFILQAAQTVVLGDNTINPVQGTAFPASGENNQLPPPSVFTYGTVGSLPAPIQGNMSLSLGNNLSIPGFVNGNNAGEPLGWPVMITETIRGSVASGFFGAPPFPTGNFFLTPSPLGKLETGQNGITSPARTNNGLAVLLGPSSMPGDVNIFMGSGGFSHRESLVVNGLFAGNMFVLLASDGTEIPDGNPNPGVYVVIDHTVLTDNMFGDLFTGSAPGLTMTDIGHGKDLFFFGLLPANNSPMLPTSVFGLGSSLSEGAGDVLTMGSFLFVSLSDSGMNFVEAHNTTCVFGIIAGNPSGLMGDQYQDDGGNAGFQHF